MLKSGFIVAMYFTTFEGYRNTRRPCYVSKRASALESSEPLHSLRLNEHVGAIPT